MKLGYDNDKYIRTQSAHIRERIAKFGGKLYLEFGGKLYDDNHASRVLPGFRPDSKLQMLLQLKDQVEMVIAINADDIEKNKIRGDLGITYDRDVIRLIGVFRDFGLYVSSVVLTRFSGQSMAKAFSDRLEAGQHPGSMVIVIELAAEFQIQLSAKLGDPLPDVLGLQGQIFLVIESNSMHRAILRKSKYSFYYTTFARK